MKKTFLMAALFAGIAGTASAATLDFTANNNTSGSVLGTTWTVSSRPVNSLTNSTHKNNVGCTGAGWDFVCAAAGSRYDVGFGVNGNNNNEIDGKIPGPDEYVQVDFGSLVKVTGYAGMLTYADVAPADKGDREKVRLQYHDGSGWVWAKAANPLFIIDQFPGTGGSFDTVGLAFLDGLSIVTDRVRFFARGNGDADDGTFNVTAAGLKLEAVPVPAALPLLMAGVGALGFAARRKKRKATA